MSTRLSNLIKRWLQSRRHDLSVHYQQKLVFKVLEEIQLESGHLQEVKGRDLQ